MRGLTQRNHRHFEWPPAPKTESGSALPLLPVFIIICFLMGSMAVSTASTFLAKRELTNAVAAAANDAVSGINDRSYFTNSTYEFDQATITNFAKAAIRSRTDLSVKEVESIIVTQEGGGVRVTVVTDFQPIFRGFLPSKYRKVHLRATALAEAQTAP